MLHPPLEILLIEDNPGDEGLIRAALDDVPGAACSLHWEATLDGGLRRLKTDRFDAVLLDLDLGPTHGLATLSRVQNEEAQLPVVVLTGHDDVETGVRAVQAGAQDYLIKGRADGGQVWRALCYAVERHRAEQTIRRLNETLEHRVDLRTRELTLANEEMLAFVRSCAHDLRGPLRMVEGLVSVIIDEHGANLSEDGLELLERTRRAVVRQDAILTALARFAQTAAAQVNLQALDFAPVVRSIVEDHRRRAPRRNVVLRVAEPLPAEADPGILQMALDNLLSNAWKFTGGRDPAEITVGLLPGRSPAVYFVKDNGVGFDQQFAGKLFRPFQRLHDDRLYPGAGLGLTTVQRVVRLHGGTVWAEAEPDRGATFYFTLAPADPTGRSPSAASSGGGRPHSPDRVTSDPGTL